MTKENDNKKAINRRYKKILAMKGKRGRIIQPQKPVVILKRPEGRFGRMIRTAPQGRFGRIIKKGRKEGKFERLIKRPQKPLLIPASTPLPIKIPVIAVRPTLPKISAPAYRPIVKRPPESKWGKFKPRVGQPGWFEESLPHSIARKRAGPGKTSLWRSIFGGMSYEDRMKFRSREVEKEAQRRQLLKDAGSKYYRNFDYDDYYEKQYSGYQKKDRAIYIGVRDKLITYDFIKDEIRRYNSNHQIKLVTLYRDIGYYYEWKSGKQKLEHKGHPLPYAAGRKKRIQERALKGFTIKLKFPGKLTTIEYRKWIKHTGKIFEGHASKMMPEGGAPFSYKGASIPANPKRKHFYDKRLSKTFNIKIDLKVDEANYPSIVGNLDYNYNHYIGQYIEAILQGLRSFYGNHFMRGKLNFTQYTRTGDEIIWDENIPYIAVKNYWGFREDAKLAMRKGFSRLGTYDITAVVLDYIEVSFTTDQPQEDW